MSVVTVETMARECEDISSLVKRASDFFLQRFKYEGTVVVCSPGRVNLIGGQSTRLKLRKLA